jgi:hypothetical protein
MAEDFHIDLTGHELARRAFIAEALDPVDEAEAEADEAKAWKLLYGDLDEHQQAMYDMLVEQGVLPSG